MTRLVRVEPEVLEFEVCSDCGEFQQTVFVQREGLQSRSEGGIAQIFRSLVRRLLGYPENQAALPPEEMEEATKQAFEQVRSRMAYRDGKWVRTSLEEHPGEYFDRQLRANPIVEPYDVEVLVRVLLEVSRSDSELRREERAFLEEIVPDEDTVKRLSKAPNITVAELAEASSIPVKETILMLSWAMAYADGHLDNEEMERLNQLCKGFLLPPARVRELQMAAKLFLLDRHLQANKSHMSLQELKASFEQKAQQWGLDDNQLATLRSWYPKELA